MRPYLIIVCLFLFASFSEVKSQPINQRVVDAMAKNDHEALVSCLNPMVDLQIPGYSGNFSQSQASVILKKFLAGHRIDSVILTKEGTNSDGSRYALGDLITGGKKYRLYFVTRNTDGKERVLVLKITAFEP